MLHISIGQSSHPDAVEAGRQAARAALASVEQPRHSNLGRLGLVLVFGAIGYAQTRLIEGVGEIVGRDVVLVGCSSSAQISSFGINQGTVVIMLVWPGSQLAMRPVLATGVRQDPFAAGLQLAQRVLAQVPHAANLTTRVQRIGAQFVTIRPYSLLMFSDHSGADLIPLVLATSRTLGPGFQIVGGVSADDYRFEPSFLYYNGIVYSDAVVGVVLVSRAPTAVGMCHGSNPQSRSMIVTRADGNVLQELDGRPAALVYADEFGPLQAPIHALGNPDWNGQYRLCSPVRTQVDGSIVLAGEVAVGSDIRWTACPAEYAVRAARTAAVDALSRLGSATPAAALVLTSAIYMQRNGVEASRQKLQAIQSILGANVPIIGLSTYNEYAASNLNISEIHDHGCLVYLLGR